MSVIINKVTNYFPKQLSSLIYFLIAHLYFLLSAIPLIVLIFRTPADSFFPLYHSIVDFDYNVYLSAITQGAHGSWLMRNAFTTEATNPTVFYIFYILLGKATGIFHLPSYIVYHLGRLLSVELFIISLFLLNLKLHGKSLGSLSSCFAIIGTIAPVVFFNEKKAFIEYFPWWFNLEALKRLDALPHYLFSYSLLFFSLILIFSYFQKYKIKYLLISLFTTFCAGIIFPPSLLPIIIALPISYALSVTIRLLKEKSLPMEPHWQSPWFLFQRPDGANIPYQKTNSSMGKTRGFLGTGIKPKDLLAIMTIVAVAFCSLLIIWHENQNGFPWNIWNKWEIAKWNYQELNFNYALFLSFGLLPLLALPAAVQSIKSGNFQDLFLSLWAYLPFLLLPFINFLGISKLRLTTIAPFVPLGALSAITCVKSEVSTGLRSWLHSLQDRKYFKRPILAISLIMIFLISSIPVSIDTLRRVVSYNLNYPNYLNIFIPKSGWQTYQFIGTNIPKNSIILSGRFTGNIIPAYAPVTSYIGHHVHTRDFFQKEALVERFYDNMMAENEAREFLTKNGIQYVFFGLGEMKTYSQTLKYEFLREIYRNGYYRLYSVE